SLPMHLSILFRARKAATISYPDCIFTHKCMKEGLCGSWGKAEGVNLEVKWVAVLKLIAFKCRVYFVTCHYRAPPDTMTDGSCTLNTVRPRCSKHNRFCVLRVVRKNGENKGRQFYACPLPGEARCNYFEWADQHFPFCNHAKRCIMRTVLKIGPNNGRNFFVCPLGKERQCDFFQWAENSPGMKIIPGC
ncbi:hypothetical protein JRQ81_015591, partial [Phrynocephalus forsythii]